MLPAPRVGNNLPSALLMVVFIAMFDAQHRHGGGQGCHQHGIDQP